MRLEKVQDLFIFHCEFAEQQIPRAARFWWSPQRKKWICDAAVKAAALVEYADSSCREELEAIAAERVMQLHKSRALEPSSSFSAKHPLETSLFPFQAAGVEFALSRHNVLFADEMGLGKTVQALVLANHLNARNILVVCPKSVKLNWLREARKWLMRDDLTIGVIGKEVPDTDVIIGNYESIVKFARELRQTSFDLLVVDEVHYCKNENAQRSQAVYALNAKVKVALTGTPIVNRPKELLPLLSWLDSSNWGSKTQRWNYLQRYCDAVQKTVITKPHRDKDTGEWVEGGPRTVWDFSGSSNLDELQERLRSTIMVRRLKSEVLKDLPPKLHSLVELDGEEFESVLAKEQTVWETVAKEKGLNSAFEEAISLLSDEEIKELLDFTTLSSMRHEMALKKVESCLEHLDNLLEEVGKVVVFAHHRDVIDALRKHFGARAVCIFGDTPDAQRQEAVDRFQNNSDVNVFIGSITACAEGITLHASSNVVFCELDWRPGKMDQAADRCHRIGQKNCVQVQWLVVDGSLDALMAKRLMKKLAVIRVALDEEVVANRQVAEAQAVVQTSFSAAVRAAEREASETSSEVERAIAAAVERATQLHAVNEKVRIPDREDLRAVEVRGAWYSVTPQEIAVVHSCLRQMASMNIDAARERNGVGFNQLDSDFGNQLAAREFLTPKQALSARALLKKYRNTQLAGLNSWGALVFDHMPHPAR
jgi:SWI/SNF-related matrix-associated actin-dependent regulator 1 of chromatin subfamily A